MRFGELVGREAELRELEAVLDAARRDRAAVALVGEPGIGKTRMLSALCERAFAAGFEVMSGRGSEMEQDVPFGLAVDALDEPLRARGRAAVASLGAERIGDLGAVLPGLASPGERLTTQLEVERYRSHQAVRIVLDRLARDRPLLLCLDDVHWADPASIELVSHLLRRGVGHALLALAYRPGKAPGRLQRVVESLRRDGVLSSLELPPLSLAAVGELLDGEHNAPTVEALHRESGGIPFYLEQLVRGLPGEGSAAPERVRAAIEQELAWLSDDARRLIDAAAVVGEPFELDLAAAIAELDEPTARTAVDELVGADLVRPTDVPRQLLFRHPIVRRAIYEAVSVGWRLGAHQRAAHVLAERGAGLGVRAHHVERSAGVGDEHAIALLADAGHAAAARAPAAAARWFEAALRLLPDGAEPAERLALIVPLASALSAVGRLKDSRDTLARALDLAPLAQRSEIVAMIARAEHGLGHTEAARELLEDALAQVDARSRDAAALQLTLAENRLSVGHEREAAVLAGEARALARSLGDDALDLTATGLLTQTTKATGLTAETRAYLQEAVPRIDALPDERLGPYLDALATLTTAEIFVARPSVAAAHAERGVSVSRDTGRGFLFLRFLQLLAAATMLDGNLDEAARAADGAVEATLLLDNDQMLGYAMGVRCRVLCEQGDMATALALGAEAIEALERAPGWLYPWFTRTAYAEALIESGRPEEGREQVLLAAGPDLGRMGLDARCRWYTLLVPIELEAGRVDAAEEMVRRADAAAADLALERLTGDAHHARASLLIAAGEHAEAAGHARQAIEHHRASGWTLSAGRSQLLSGRALTLAGETEAAARVLSDALALFERCGAMGLRGRAAKQLRALGQRVPRSSPTTARTGLGGLTEREREVAELVALGYTNRRIATELFVSQRTVEAHLPRVFAKLDVSGRTSVAAAIGRGS